VRALLLGLVFSIATISSAIAQQRQVLSGHVPQLVKDLSLQPVARVAGTNVLHLAIGLRLRDASAARAFVQQLYDPASPLYHQYLTPAQFTEKFGPSMDDYQAVINFARASGFTVTRTDPNRLLVDVAARAADVESAFQVKMLLYQHPTEARRFYAPDVEPSVPSGIKILDVSGISSYPRPHPNSHVGGLGGRAVTPIPNGGSVPGGQYIGKDFRAAYVPGSPLTGVGQSVALVQFDNYYPSDIARYEALAGLPSVTLSNIMLDSYTGTIGSGNGEVSLDIEMIVSMAPGVSEIYLYEGNPAEGFFFPNDVLQQIYSDNNSRQISCSWGWSGGPTDTTDNIFIEMAGNGQTFFVASGDSAAYPGSSADSPSGFGTPAVSAYVTSVGGTTLSTAGPTNNWTSETVWNWFTEFATNIYNGVGSSGGYSAYYSIPTWQQGVNHANLGSTTGRNFPDVALTGDHVLVAYGNGTTNWFGGTSCASPLWAGFTALINQQGAASGKPPVGFLNPAIYAIGTGTNYTACFHDVTTGNNEWSNSPSAYAALTGFDLCTGWGTPTGSNLINALVGPITNSYLVADGSIVSGGNGNGVIDADECNLLNLIVQNIGGAAATNVNATLTTTTPGVTVTQPSSSYPSIAPYSFATNTAPFQVSTSPSFVCGTPVILTLAVSFAGGSNTLTFTLPTCTSCPSSEISAGLSASSPKQTGRLTRNGTASSCTSAKSCPGDFATSGSYAYNAYSFTNTSSGAVCVTVTLSTTCSGSGSTAIFSETYLGSFIPNSLCTDYLADLGSSPNGSAGYSFEVPANTNFTVVVNAVNVGSYCSSYTLSIEGLPCFVDGGGACAGVSANFSATPTNGAAPLAVTFADSSTGTITNRFWNFGDGATTNTTTNTLVHVYTAAGTETVTLIVSGPPGTSTNAQPNLIVVVNPAQLMVSPTSITYGTLVVGQINTQSFAVINTGGVTLNGTAAMQTGSSPFAVSGGSSYIVASGHTGTVSVAFAPAAPGAFTNAVVFASNGGASTNQVTGTALTPPQLMVSPFSQSFGTIATSTTAQGTFVVTNAGGAALSGTATITATAFGIASGASYNLAGFGSTNVVVNFTPPTVNSFTGNVIFASTGGISTNPVTGSGAVLPAASFTAVPTSGAAPLAVTFTDTSTGTIASRFWNFGDGATTNTATNTLLHVYNTAGTDTVTLIVSGPLGASTNTQPNYIVVTPAADLVLTNTVAPNPVAQGQSLNYTLTVTNLGPSMATSVTVTDALPPGVALVSAATTQGSCTNIGGTVFCNLGNLAVATNAVLTVVVTPPTPGIITNTAFVFAATPDPNMTNNAAAAITVVNPAADLSVTKTVSPNPVLTSQNLTYTLVVTNLGPSAASSVTVTDALPAGVSVVSAIATAGTCTNVGGIITCSLGNLASNAAATVTIVGTVTAASDITSIINTASVSATQFDPNPTNNAATVALTVYLDSVGDGIPDWWRQQYFGGSGATTGNLSCATCDADGTGQNNMFKYVAGLDPTNPASVFTLNISSVTNQPTWQSLLLNPLANGRTYTPQFSTDLVNGIWLPLSGFAGPVSNGNQITITDTNAVLPYEFYRIDISLP
jgi:uncharacterized repeat protein (TIGR01451 family)